MLEAKLDGDSHHEKFISEIFLTSLHFNKLLLLLLTSY